MSARVEAVSDAMITYVDDNFLDELETAVGEVLAAADAVMFSDDAIERAAQSLHGEHGLYWHAMTEAERERRRDAVRAVIAALKGDDK